MEEQNSKIAVVVCSRDADLFAFLERNLRRTAGGPFDLIRIDNSAGDRGICSAYNEGLARTQADVVVFQHEDVFHVRADWVPLLQRKFANHRGMALLGVAGTSLLRGNPPLWTSAGQPFLAGRVIHELDGGRRFFLTEFSPEGPDREVVAVDGLWFAARRTAALAAGFDGRNFPGFHFYDLDFSLRIRKYGSLYVTTELLVKHFSPGNFGDAWKEAAAQFLAIHGAELPVSIAGVDPASPSTGEFTSYDLKGKVPQITLV